MCRMGEVQPMFRADCLDAGVMFATWETRSITSKVR